MRPDLTHDTVTIVLVLAVIITAAILVIALCRAAARPAPAPPAPEPVDPRTLCAVLTCRNVATKEIHERGLCDDHHAAIQTRRLAS